MLPQGRMTDGLNDHSTAVVRVVFDGTGNGEEKV